MKEKKKLQILELIKECKDNAIDRKCSIITKEKLLKLLHDVEKLLFKEK
jgi:hypothetical protein